MSPHKQDPASWEIEIDLSEILIRPEEVEREEVESRNAILDWTDWSLDMGDKGTGSFAWGNISFVLGSCLIGLICLSIFNTSHIRGEGHVDRMSLSVRGRNLIRHDHSVSVWNLLPRPTQVAYSQRSPTLPTLVPFGEEQSPAFSPGVGGVADRASTNAVSPLGSDTGAAERGSRATASSAENASSNQQTSSAQSSRSALRRRARKPIITSRTNVSSGYQNFKRTFRKLGAGNSTSRTKRRTASSVKSTPTGRRIGPRFRS